MAEHQMSTGTWIEVPTAKDWAKTIALVTRVSVLIRHYLRAKVERRCSEYSILDGAFNIRMML